MATLVHLDTHVVAWLFAGESARLPAPVRRRIQGGPIAISPMVELELQFLFEIGRTNQPGPVVVKNLMDGIGLGVSECPFPAVAAVAAQLSWTRDPFDRVITAQAMAEHATLLTRDKIIRANFRGAVWD
jgi:PIN domain nuclease of toxin-antitoxin system